MKPLRVVTPPRIVVKGATTAITRRTTLRKSFLAPWDPEVEKCWLYALADAQRMTDMAVHHSVLVVNHHHTSCTPSKGNFPEFTRRFHRDFSCALHALLCARRYDAPRELFDDRQTHMMRLLDAPAQASHLIYEYLNPVAAGLVQRPEHMPIRTLDFDLWKVGFIEVERPAFYFGSSRPERLQLELTPPPLLYRAFGGDLERLVYHMNRLAKDGIRGVREARKRPVLGARALQRLHPWSEPRSLRESGGGRVPTFRIGARDIVGRTAHVTSAKEVREFRRQHEESRIARRDGDHERRFPFGTFAMRVHHGAPVEPEAPSDAIVAQPGPLLCDVDAELEREGISRDQVRDSSRTLVDEVRQVFLDESADILENALVDLSAPTPVHSPRGSAGAKDSNADPDAKGAEASAERDPVVVRHRFAERRPETAPRMVSLRDRRRGRPPRGSGPHGSDPPV